MSGRLVVVLFLAAVLLSFSYSPAVAQKCCNCNADYIQPTSDSEWNDPWPKGSTPVINTHIDNEFNAHETWLVKFLLEDNIIPAMMLMAEQLTVGAIQQIGILGMLFDAKQQVETQRSFQKIQADIHRDYHPSMGLCEFGSFAQSLAATERLADYNAVFLAQRSLDRHLGSAYSSGYGGEYSDKENRLKQFVETYCDKMDNNGGLTDICKVTAGPERLNRDIDFSRTLGTPRTLDINYARRAPDNEITDDEIDVFALQNNMFGHKVFTRIPTALLKKDNISGPAGGLNSTYLYAREALMDMRSLAAKRGVAENSFSQLVADKAEGTGASTPYLYEMMKELGVGLEAETEPDLEEMLGKNPSYYAQMEVLTKKIYQNPDFYTNLYDTPANVSRKEAAISALELIQKFDMFKSNLRAEANLSLMLETAVMELQIRAENNFPESSNRPHPSTLHRLDTLGGSSAQP